MARFCSQCGKPLEEGQVCDCQEQNRRNAIEPVQKEVDQSAAAPQAAAGTVPPQQGAVPVPPDFGAYQGGMQQQPQNPQGYQQVPLGAQPYYQQQVAAPKMCIRDRVRTAPLLPAGCGKGDGKRL